MRAGYVVIIQDCRGRFESEGSFKAFVNEAKDGYDTVEWAAAAERPPHLKAIAPMITWSDRPGGTNFRGGALELGIGLYWTLEMALETLPRLMRGADPQLIYARSRELADFIDRLCLDGYTQLPLTDIPGLRSLGLSQAFAGLVGTPPAEAGREAPVRAEEAAVPSLDIGGWYDVFQAGVLDNFMAARAAGQPAHLLMGPWTHLNHGSAVQDVEFGLAARASLIDLTTDITRYHLRWFDHWLKGAANGVDTEPPVRIFVMGENRWRSENEWPLARTVYTPWYLHGGGGARGTGAAGGVPANGGGLSPVAPGAGDNPDSFTYDPANPVPTLGGNVLMPGSYGSGTRDQRPLEARPDVLSFTSEPLTVALDVIGPVTVKLWAASDAPDTDFVARLIDVRPDGFAQNLADGIIRVRYRQSLSAAEPLQPGEVFEYTIDLWAVSNRFVPETAFRSMLGRLTALGELVGAGARWRGIQPPVGLLLELRGSALYVARRWDAIDW